MQGRKSRFRTADDLEAIIRENVAQGINALLHHRRQFRPQPHWEEFFDRLIELRESEGLDGQPHHPGRHAVPSHPELHREGRAGRRRPRVHRAGEHQSRQPAGRQEAPEQDHRIPPDAAGLARPAASSPAPATSSASPATRQESILRDIEIIKRELPLDILEFFILTPLPGSEDHQKLLEARACGWTPTSTSTTSTTASSTIPRCRTPSGRRPIATPGEPTTRPSTSEVVVRRAAACAKGRPRHTMQVMLWFYMAFFVEKLHPLEGGVIRRKHRRDRRSGLAIENPAVFYIRYVAEVIAKTWHYSRMIFVTHRMYNRIMRDPLLRCYSDVAITPVDESELETLAMFTQTSGGQAEVAKKHRADELRTQIAKLQAAE